MDARGLPIVSPKIDYRDVESISAQRLLCFINHFHAHTVAFLNSFATTCERRLTEVNWRIQRTEAILSVLEAKLSSIPGLESVTLPTVLPSPTVPEVPPETLSKLTDVNPDHVNEESLSRRNETAASTNSRIAEDKSDNVVVPSSSSSLVRAKDHPDYAKYFRMIQLGVPLQAVMNKCGAENSGIDASVLETPERLIPRKVSSDEEKDDDDEGWSQ